ncbi:GGDEF domain-containing protein [Marinobacterium lutimaris]|uniref:diguanylate cyclase n=1 Tax=Marinobacterium lutimaris TaxID=568106 RepID=A0A1H5TT21_9GAMM|nr:GGDEF domain-containing protein [Marinobacterium lutimaris]SEF65920.1 diguanylate cyclase (GGDEF) domain-containing protein [Marinobacterium lutimaris]
MKKNFVLVFAVFVVALIGIFSRPSGYLADLWPANSLILGFILRDLRLVKNGFWLWSGVAMVAADLVTGSGLSKAVVLNAGNIFAVMAGVAVACSARLAVYPVRDTVDVLNIALVAFAAAVAAGLFGMFANPLLFAGSVTEGLTYWFVTEFVNYVVFLPLIMVAPTFNTLTPEIIKQRLARVNPLALIPGVSVIALCLLAMTISGPGVIAVPLIGLLWCAFTYSVFNTALVTLVYCVWTLISLSNGYIDPDQQISYWLNVISLRVSVAMIALVPILLSCYIHRNRARLKDLEYASNHDELTGTLTRRALYSLVQEKETPASMTLLMIDLDHFKSINDNHGHPVGDRVLRHFVEIARRCLRPDDAFCRMGGEEFMVVLSDLPSEDANRVAARIRATFEENPLVLDSGETIDATVSIGVAVKYSDDDDFDALASKADRALYEAKHGGRNRIIHFAD